jgi:hypothetical protein
MAERRLQPETRERLMNSMARAGQLRRAAVVAATLAVAACTSSGTSFEATMPEPRPDAIIVEPFAASPDEIRTSETLVERLKTMAGDTPRTPDERAVGRKVADAIADRLVLEIRDMGLPAQKGTAAPPEAKSPLFITGQLVSIDEGNRAERVIIGLGAGRSDVRVQTQVYEGVGGVRRLVEEIEVDAKSGMTPGMLETAGVGALTGHVVASLAVGGALHVASEDLATGVVADADRAAKGIAKQLSAYFGRQGWTR